MPPPPVEIRLASAQDAKALTDLGAKTFWDAFARYNHASDMDMYMAETFREDLQAAEIADTQRKTYIAWHSTLAVGYLQLVAGSTELAVTGPSPIELRRLYVDASMHGQGVAASLMQTGMATAEQLGFKTIWLGVWEHNLRALAFYKKWAFQEVGCHTFQLGRDPQRDLIMQRAVIG